MPWLLCRVRLTLVFSPVTPHSVPLSIRHSPDTVAPSLHLLYLCLPRFSLFPFLQPSSTSFIHFRPASLINSQNYPFISPLIHSSSQLLFLPNSPHPTAVGSKCRGDSAWAKISFPPRSLSMYQLIESNRTPGYCSFCCVFLSVTGPLLF